MVTRTRLNITFIHTLSLSSGADPGFMGPEACTILGGASLRNTYYFYLMTETPDHVYVLVYIY